jgi:hypothetical protein
MLPLVVRAAGEGQAVALAAVNGAAARVVPVVFEQSRSGRFLNLMA